MVATPRLASGPGRPSEAPLWAVTCFFNPAGYRRKLENYRVFRERLGVPLVAVEHAVDGRFELGPGDADVLVQVPGGDVMWQKERLLNVGLRALPPACDAVAWIDCDVVFDDPDWGQRARAALERVGLVHLFHERHNLPADTPLEGLASWSAPPTSVSAVHRLELGTASVDDLICNDAQLLLGSTVGLAWAARRATLDAHGLYDASVIGGGDRMIVCAALGRFELAQRCQRLSDRHFAHYLGWARPFHAAVEGVGAIPGRAFHLWHGDLRDRQYETRFDLLAGFDPLADVARDPGGSWRWSSAKPELHRAVRRYFAQRCEDGAGEAALAAPDPVARAGEGAP
jgi:hypothetical protein